VTTHMDVKSAYFQSVTVRVLVSKDITPYPRCAVTGVNERAKPPPDRPVRVLGKWLMFPGRYT
jgi:hypothetical protein